MYLKLDHEAGSVVDEGLVIGPAYLNYSEDRQFVCLSLYMRVFPYDEKSLNSENDGGIGHLNTYLTIV